MAVAEAERPPAGDPVGGPRSAGGRAWRWVLAICLAGWVALAGYLFFTPEPERLTRDVDPSLGHLYVFAAVAATAMAAARTHSPQLVRVPALFGVGMAGGLAVEVGQHVLSTARGFELFDLAADAAGLALGIGVVWLLERSIRRRRLVVATVAVVSAALLVTTSAAVVVGPERLHRWQTCWGHEHLDGGTLIRLSPAAVEVAGARGATEALESQLAPLRGPQGYRFDGSRSASLLPPPAVTCALEGAGGFAVVARLAEVPLDQQGPARIITLSTGIDPMAQDLHLGVVGDAVSIRVRTDRDSVHMVEVPGVLQDQPVELELRHDGAVLTLAVNGVTAYERRLDVEPSSWGGRPITIGDEDGGQRPFRGTIASLELRSR